MDSNLVFRSFSTLVNELFSFFYFNCSINKVFQFVNNYKNHVTQLYVLLVKGHQIFLFIFYRPFATQIEYALRLIEPFESWYFRGVAILAHRTSIHIPIQVNTSHRHFEHAAVILIRLQFNRLKRF